MANEIETLPIIDELNPDSLTDDADNHHSLDIDFDDEYDDIEDEQNYSQVTANLAKSDLTPGEMNLIGSLNPLWYLRDIGADKENEIKEFSEIVNYLKTNQTLSIPTEQLLKFNIHPTHSTLLEKLAKNRKVSFKNNAMTFLYQTVTKENLANKINLLNEFYSEMLNPDGEHFSNFPTSHFVHFEDETIIRLKLDKIAWKNVNSEVFAGKLIEIAYPNSLLPPILATQTAFELLQKISIAKVIITIQKKSGEDPQFFEQRLELDRKKLSLQYPRLFDFEFNQLSQGSTRLYREQYSNIVLKKIFSNKSATKMFLIDFDNPKHSQMLRVFSIEKIKNFDFIQSFYFLKEIFLNNDINQLVKLEDLSNFVYNSPTSFVTMPELKAEVQRMVPDIPNDWLENIIERFKEKYLQKNNITGHPQIYQFHISLSEFEDLILVSRLNIDKIVNNSLLKLQKTIPQQIIYDWTESIKRHQLLPEMFIKSSFSSYVFELAQKEKSFIISLANRAEILSIIKTLDKASKFTLKLKFYPLEEMTEILDLKQRTLYEEAYANASRQFSPFFRFFFYIIHWFKRKSTNTNPVSPAQGQMTANISVTPPKKETLILKKIGYNSIESLTEKCNKLWERMPDGLSQKELDRNILDDLSTFLRDKDEISIKALEYIDEKNLNRILNKGKHLANVATHLEKYIKAQVYLTVLQHASLRNKISMTL